MNSAMDNIQLEQNIKDILNNRKTLSNFNFLGVATLKTGHDLIKNQEFLRKCTFCSNSKQVYCVLNTSIDIELDGGEHWILCCFDQRLPNTVTVFDTYGIGHVIKSFGMKMSNPRLNSNWRQFSNELDGSASIRNILACTNDVLPPLLDNDAYTLTNPSEHQRDNAELRRLALNAIMVRLWPDFNIFYSTRQHSTALYTLRPQLQDMATDVCSYHVMAAIEYLSSSRYGNKLALVRLLHYCNDKHFRGFTFNKEIFTPYNRIPDIRMSLLRNDAKIAVVVEQILTKNYDLEKGNLLPPNRTDALLHVPDEEWLKHQLFLSKYDPFVEESIENMAVIITNVHPSIEKQRNLEYDREIRDAVPLLAGGSVAKITPPITDHIEGLTLREQQTRSILGATSQSRSVMERLFPLSQQNRDSQNELFMVNVQMNVSGNYLDELKIPLANGGNMIARDYLKRIGLKNPIQDDPYTYQLVRRLQLNALNSDQYKRVQLRKFLEKQQQERRWSNVQNSNL